MFSCVATDLGSNTSPGAQSKKGKVRSPLIVEFGNPVDKNIHLCYYRFWPGDISRKAQETQIGLLLT